VALAVGCSFALLTSTQNTIAELAGIVCALGVAVLTILGGAAILTTSRPPHSSEEAK
jgi:hypothetical protein